MIAPAGNNDETYGQPHGENVRPAPQVSGEGGNGEIETGAAGNVGDAIGGECCNGCNIPKEGEIEQPARAPSGLTAIHDARLERRAILEGWTNPSQRFPTRVPLKELQAQVDAKEGNETLVERLTLNVADGMKNGSERRKGICERTAVVMERMNQSDDHHGEGERVVHEHSGTIQLTTEQRRSRLVEILDGLRERKRIAGNRVSDNGHSVDAACGIGPIDAGPLCGDGEPGPMDDGESPESSGSGDSGSDDWFGF